jgi:hypothetical protein
MKGVRSHNHLAPQEEDEELQEEEDEELQRIHLRMGRDACQAVPGRALLWEWLPVQMTCRRAREGPAAACVGATPHREQKHRIPFDQRNPKRPARQRQGKVATSVNHQLSCRRSSAAVAVAALPLWRLIGDPWICIKSMLNSSCILRIPNSDHMRFPSKTQAHFRQ